MTVPDGTPCGRDGCAGSIAGGYCDTCGMAPRAEASASSAGGSAASAAGTPAAASAAPGSGPSLDGSPCGRPGCGGTIADGYCDTCGMAPAVGSARSSGAGSGSPSAGQGGSGEAAASPSGRTGTGRTSGRVDVSLLTGRGSRRTGSTGTRSSRSTRSRVGAGVIEVARTEPVDPSTIVMPEPSVPEGKRYCANCDKPVGRGQGDRPGRVTGYCPHCGARFDFAAKLHAGDVVAGQYEVAGPLAHGGLGWIYLARDRNVSGRWSVLKGLLDTASPDAAEAAVAERRFLAEVRHPAIVGIHNFVQHEGQGYIVMEYVGGPSLKQLTARRREAGDGPMPVAEAAAYVLAVLPALGYLHERGLVYCDFKPDNVIHEGDDVKLIDLGAVRRIDDPDAAIFGTVGYQAPEVARTGPTVASDLYTVGRGLAVLILDWPQWQGADAEHLPLRSDHPVLVEHDCLWRFLERACHLDPERRFRDAAEMTDSLYGVLCMVAAADDGEPRPRTSTRYSPPRPRLEALGWQGLPTPLLPNHPTLANRVAGVSDGDPDAVAALVGSDDRLSWADIAAVARAHCELGDPDEADAVIGRLDPSEPEAAEFVAVLENAKAYLHGIAALAAGDPGRAVTFLAEAYSSAPGEPATALALAVALGARGDKEWFDEAADLFQQVAVTDPSWVLALAGLAWALDNLDRSAEAARVLTAVPPSHPLRAQALTYACLAMETGRFDPAVADVVGERLRSGRAGTGAGRRPGGAVAEPSPRGRRTRAGRAAGARREAADAELAATLYRAALAARNRGETLPDQIGGSPADPRELAEAAEAALLDLADATPDPARRHELLDTAARTRPWSLW